MTNPEDTDQSNQSFITLTLDRLPRTVVLNRILNADDDLVESGIKLELTILDQTMLPAQEAYLITDDWKKVVDAIKLLQVRGAPAIGIAGAAAVALYAAELAMSSEFDLLNYDDGFSPIHTEDNEKMRTSYWSALEKVAREISAARPTAVNLSWACDHALNVAREHLNEGDTAVLIAGALYDFAKQLEAEDEECNHAIGANGAALLTKPSTVLTHCNAGSLATAFYGTALGVVYTAAQAGHIKRVYAGETRPIGQGARLTTWELSRAGVPVTLICDNMAASVMASGVINAVFVGADRIAANGDVANKIGTYGLAVLAQYHDIPFYVAAPTSTIDTTIETGAQIPIEQRDKHEILAPDIDGVDVFNPAFDVTPAHLIAKIITERGVFEPNDLCNTHDE